MERWPTRCMAMQTAASAGELTGLEARCRRRQGLSLACRLVPIDPISVRWTLHALDKAQQLGFTRRDVESAVLEGHRERRRNKGQARWLVAAGRLVVAYEHPDDEDPLIAPIVTVWRRR